ncbi:hypothetical protein QYE76_067013 [Lolium multiflorum]|uniref:Uncharacterized protein n=1 Tax=Lolium multiflorum TaxID=4521 RepID=A0AAD8SCQ7_LOLMU|nr:hypothetical protein QYE76_067013 [Lolium multiflorum]
MLVTPQVETPPKPSSSAAPNPKDVINLDDLPEDPTAESGQGGSGKGESGKDASSSHPPPEQPDITSAEATAHDAEQKLPLSGATGMPQTHPHLFPILQKVPLSQRHAEMSHMMNEVWGNPEAEEQMLSKFEGEIKVFFAQHKHVRQNTRNLYEDLHVHVLEQKAEIEGLRQSYADSQKVVSILETHVKNYEEEIAKHPSIDELSAQLEVLKAENESLKKFLQESSEKETKKKKELEEKNAQEMADLDDKLKKNQQRVKTLAGKNKAYETEEEAIEKLIFPTLGFEWTNDSTLKRTEAYDEARGAIDDLFEACRGIAKSLSLKRAGTTLIDTMTKLMRQGFSDAEDEEEEGVEEGFGSSANHSKEGSGEDSGDGSANVASEDDHSSE